LLKQGSFYGPSEKQFGKSYIDDLARRAATRCWAAQR